MKFFSRLSELRALGKKKEDGQKKLDSTGLWKIYKVFGRHYKKHWKTLLVAYGCLFIVIGIEVLNPWPLKLVLDHLLVRAALPENLSFLQPLFAGPAKITLLLLAAAILVLTVAEAMFSYVNKFWISSCGDKMVAEIRERVFAHMNRLSLSFHESASAGNMLYNITSDVGELKTVLIDFPQDFIHRMITFAAYAVLMMWLDWRLGLIALSTTPLVYLVTKYFRAGMKVMMKRARRRVGELTSILIENVKMMAVVQAYGREQVERERLAKSNQDNLEAQMQALRLHRAYSRVSDFLVVLSSAGVLYWGGRFAVGNEILPGTLVVFVAYMRSVTTSLEKFTGLFLGLAKAQVSIERLIELVENDMVMQDRPNAVTAPRFQGRLEFKNVSFAYKAGHEVLRNLNFVVEPGETVALVGHSGAGKSTLISLLLRFYDPQHGQICIDGQDLRSFSLKSLRRQMTILLQEAQLFRQSVRENLAFGKPEAREEEIVAAAKMAEAHDFIMQMPTGYNTLIHEGGDNLSGGQRQRLNIARAIMRNTPIVILDEPTTGLDIKAETKVNLALRHLTQEKTTFIIAHKFSTILNADKILLLEDGQLADQGTHEELLRQSPPYRELYELQFGWQKKLSAVAADTNGNAGTVETITAEEKASPALRA